ncbi:RDD family protein [Moraxella caviae]|nr:RDD family protein [Moraxella caviae]
MTRQTKKSSTAHTQPAAHLDDEVKIAKPLVRLAALLYDGMLILSMLFLTSLVLTVIGTQLLMDTGTAAADAQTLPAWYQNGVMTPMAVLTLVGFYGVFWRKTGQTLGMQTWRLKTVTTDGQLLDWRASFVRIIYACLLPMLCAIIGTLVYGGRLAAVGSAFLGLLCNYAVCWFNARGFAAHDILSNTMTLKVPKIAHEGIFASLKKRGK